MTELFRNLCSIAFVVFCLTLHASAFREEDVGETIPAHIDINVGDSVNISCLINPVRFKIGNSNEKPCEMTFKNPVTKKSVPEEDIVVMNSTYIVYTLRNATEQSLRLRCYCGGDAIAESTIYVGTAPRDVTQFNCRSYDFEYMVCNFTQPENPVLTQYNLTYYINSPDYKTPAYCNFDMKPLVVCNITAEHSYRPQVEEYHFKVHSSNHLGSHKQEFTINNLNVMVPARPGQDFHIVKLTTDSMDAIWSMPKYDSYTPNKHRGLKWEVLLQPDGFAVRNISAQVRVLRVDRGCKLSLSDLPYAHYSYELSLRVKVRTAVIGEDMWSPTFKYRFRTRPRMPDRPPRTDNGGFYINPLKTEVRLYWEQLEKWEENGDNFTYVIRAIEKRANGHSRPLLPRQQEPNFAIFEWHNDLHYTFEISSRNHMGESARSSLITIYPQTSRSVKQHTPYSIHNVYHQTNRSYTLTWLPPIALEGLQNYTVYWCYSKLAMSTDCRGSIHFRHVSSKTQRFATEPQKAEHDHSLTLAVSANYLGYNTGLHWTSCSVDVNADFEPMEPEVLSISATDLRVQWSSKTVCPSILSGYNLTYCEVASTPDTFSISPPSVGGGMFEPFNSGKTVPAEKAVCTSMPINVIIDKNSNKFNITGLKPYTLYRLEMFMFSNTKSGKPNDPLLVRTFEAAPSPPRNLHVSQLTDTSAKITWLPPSETNGYIRQYIVKLNNKEFVVNATALEDTDQISFLLQNLTSFTAYKVFVIAVTRYKSDHSNDIHFTTYMSAPSKMGFSESNYMNPKEVQLKWAPPSLAGGRLDYYEIAVTQLRGDYVERRHISVVFGNSCVLRVPDCPDPDYQTKVEVRAINAASIANNEVSSLEVLAHKTEFDRDAHNYQGNEELVCKGQSKAADMEHEKANFDRFHVKNNYVLYKSDWHPLTSFGCAQRQLGKITVITLMVVCTSLMLMALMFFGTKKWKMMSDIQCTLPAALDAYLTKELNGGTGGCGLNGTIVNGNVLNDFLTTSTMRNASTPPPLHNSNERLHNEEHHLLGAHKNDSGYIGDGLLFGRSISAVAAKSTENDSSEEDFGGEHRRNYALSESSADSLIGSSTSSGGAVGDVEAQDVLPLQRIQEEAAGGTGYIQAGEVQQAAALGGYVTAADFNSWAGQSKAQPTVVQAASTLQNGYIQAGALVPTETQKTSAAAPPAVAIFSGYITSSDLNKWQTPANPSAAMAQNAKSSETACHSGYIKPSDLQAHSSLPPQPQDVISNAIMSGDYVQASDLSAAMAARTAQSQQQQQQHSPNNATGTAAPPPPMANNSGYITVDSLKANVTASLSAAPTPTPTPQPLTAKANTASTPTHAAATTATAAASTSGYVQPSTLQALLLNAPQPTMSAAGQNNSAPATNANFTNFSGYTSLDALEKLTPTQALPNRHLIEPADANKPGLIGYVTQREMNEFGQQQQTQ
ncbi:cytokine receptor [Ceratitis capitata]|uniref:Cytokine receptor n=1 Tax=Ceratitis capitata TaxID=7213 RepID=W8AVI7_CERCA|nr:cytokine receptor [Ceratitis capitata]